MPLAYTEKMNPGMVKIKSAKPPSTLIYETDRQGI